MTNKHDADSAFKAKVVTLQQIQEIIYDFQASLVSLEHANQEIQRHALELRLLDRTVLPPGIDPLRFVRSSARAIERARAARDRLNAAGPDHHPNCPNHPDAQADPVVEPVALSAAGAAAGEVVEPLMDDVESGGPDNFGPPPVHRRTENEADRYADQLDEMADHLGRHEPPRAVP
jgi:hypothetical protein